MLAVDMPSLSGGLKNTAASVSAYDFFRAGFHLSLGSLFWILHITKVTVAVAEMKLFTLLLATGVQAHCWSLPPLSNTNSQHCFLFIISTQPPLFRH
jgi:hypothetical protein